MKFFGIEIAREKRSKPPGATDDFWYLAANAMRSLAGVTVSPESVLRVAVALSCVRVVSETLGTLPLKSFVKSGRTRSEENDSSVSRIFTLGPNDFITTADYVEKIVAELLLRGDHLSVIKGTRGVEVTSLEPVHPDNFIKVEAWRQKENGRQFLIYYVRNAETKEVELFTHEEVLHIKGLQCGSSPYRGTSVISHAADAFGTAIAAENFAASTFKNQGMPAGILEYPEGLDEDEVKNIVQSWQQTYGGADNAGKIAILEHGLKYQKIGLTPQDTQLLDTRKFSGILICGMFRTPPHKVAIMDKATWGNIEHQNTEFLTDCLRPITVKIESAMRKQLYTFAGLDTSKFYPRFNTEGILRGDIQTRYSSYAIARQWGWMSADDIREKEDLNPLPDGQGEVYLIPMNMIPADKIDEISAKDPALDSPKVEEDPVSTNNNSGVSETRQAFTQLIFNAFAKASKIEGKEIIEVVGRSSNGATISNVQNVYSEKIKPIMMDLLEPTCRAFSQQIAAFTGKGPTMPVADLIVDTLDEFVAEYCKTSEKEVLATVYSSPDSLSLLFDSWTRGRNINEVNRLMQRLETTIFKWEFKDHASH